MKSQAKIVAALMACALSAAGCKQNAELPQPVRPVLSMVVEPARSAETVLVGAIEPQFKTDLAFRVLGRLLNRPVKLGDSVAEGQTFCRYDQFRSARARRASCESRAVENRGSACQSERDGAAQTHPHRDRRNHQADAG